MWPRHQASVSPTRAGAVIADEVDVELIGDDHIDGDQELGMSEIASPVAMLNATCW